jgi:hypothetical protein
MAKQEKFYKAVKSGDLSSGARFKVGDRFKESEIVEDLPALLKMKAVTLVRAGGKKNAS